MGTRRTNQKNRRFRRSDLTRKWHARIINESIPCLRGFGKVGVIGSLLIKISINGLKKIIKTSKALNGKTR